MTLSWARGYEVCTWQENASSYTNSKATKNYDKFKEEPKLALDAELSHIWSKLCHLLNLAFWDTDGLVCRAKEDASLAFFILAINLFHSRSVYFLLHNYSFQFTLALDFGGIDTTSLFFSSTVLSIPRYPRLQMRIIKLLQLFWNTTEC